MANTKLTKADLWDITTALKEKADQNADETLFMEDVIDVLSHLYSAGATADVGKPPRKKPGPKPKAADVGKPPRKKPGPKPKAKETTKPEDDDIASAARDILALGDE